MRSLMLLTKVKNNILTLTEVSIDLSKSMPSLETALDSSFNFYNPSLFVLIEDILI